MERYDGLVHAVVRRQVQYIEGFYDPRRRHSSLGYLSPADYEKQSYQRHGFA